MILKSIVSPLLGRVVRLESVPDEVFSKKVLGDGCGIIPESGEIFSPVDGVVTSIADTNHAFGFLSDDGQEVLVHFGLDTVSLGGEGFSPKVKVGDRVTKGMLVCVADLDFVVKKGLNPVTCLVVCDGETGLSPMVGRVEAGDFLLEIEEEKKEENPEKPEKSLNFDFLQKLGKVLMTVIAVMPAAGLMISIGKLVGMAENLPFLGWVGGFLKISAGRLSETSIFFLR